MKPMEIEKRSFEIIASELGEKKLDPEYDLLIRRVIHTTADFDYADNLAFSDRAMGALTDALRSGCPVVTDTTMAMAGINKKTLARFGGEVHCFIGDADVAEQAKARGVTRSLVSMEKAADTLPDAVFAIGNAPTALVRLYEMLRAGQMEKPALIIGVPVGFVNVVESKELIMELDVPYIVARGRKGGSNVAAAICNALLYLASGNERS